MRSFRIARAEFPIADGQGSAIFGGQWNSVGSPVVYTADYSSTAVLEHFVDRQPDPDHPLKMARIDFPDTAVTEIDLSEIDLDDASALRETGETWISEKASAVLKVPSSRVNGGSLYILNPAHPDFPSFRIAVADVSLNDKPRRVPKPERDLEVEGLPGMRVSTWSGLVDLHGRPLRSGGEASAQVEVLGLERDLMTYLRANPGMLLQLGSRDFERAMGAFYEALGWQVTLTPESRDGGKDLIIAKSDEAGKRICYVECKRYAPDKPVHVGIVRQLWGVVDKDSVTSVLIATEN